MAPDDLADLIGGAAGGGGFLGVVEAGTREGLFQMRDARAGEKAAHPELVVEREMVARVEAADALPERASIEDLRLHPLPLAPPDAVNVEHLRERFDAARVTSERSAVRV